MRYSHLHRIEMCKVIKATAGPRKQDGPREPVAQDSVLGINYSKGGNSLCDLHVIDRQCVKSKD